MSLQTGAQVRNRLLFTQLGHEHDVAWLRQRKIPRRYRHSFVLLHQFLVQASIGCVGQYLGQCFHGYRIWVAGCCGVVEHRSQLRIAYALDADFTRALLHRVAGVSVGQRARGFSNSTEITFHQSQCFGCVQLARDDQNRVVRLVVLAVKGL